MICNFCIIKLAIKCCVICINYWIVGNNLYNFMLILSQSLIFDNSLFILNSMS